MNFKNFFVNQNTFFEKRDVKVNDNDYRKHYYSQDGEDIVLLSFYEDRPNYKGFYVDIGALHPLRFSNTHLFYEMGWKGINIDAMPGSMEEFKTIRPRDINIEAGISYKKGELFYYSFEEPALNSFNKELSESRIQKGCKFIEKKMIDTFSINEILEKYLPIDQKIDFINIDAEGLDEEIIKSLDLEKYKPNFLLIEDLDLKGRDVIEFGTHKIYKYLKKLGYLVVGKTKRTLILKIEK